MMFGGLHIEMALWNMLGDYLAGSGWTISLIDAGIASSGTADSFLKASHLTRTCHVGYHSSSNTATASSIFTFWRFGDF